MNLERITFFLSRDVVFREDIFPFKDADDEEPRVFNDIGPDPFSYDPLFVPLVDENEGNTDTIKVEALPVNVLLGNDIDRTTEPIRSSRVSRTPSWHCDFDMFVNVAKNYSIAHPISNCLSYSHLSSTFKNFVALVTRVVEPMFNHYVVRDQNWVNAMKDEISSLESNNTSFVVPLLANKKLVGCKWVYTDKYKSDGCIERYKVCLVAKGFSQHDGIDFGKNFLVWLKWLFKKS